MNEKRKKALVLLLVSVLFLFTFISTTTSVKTTILPKTTAAWGALSIEAGGGWSAMISGVATTTLVGFYYGMCFGNFAAAIAGGIVGL